MEKICSVCGMAKDEDEFAWQNKDQGKRHARCKACVRELNHERYAIHGERLRASLNANRRAKIDRVNAIKEASPCADCNTFYAWYVMEFDHIRGDKVNAVSTLVRRNNSWAIIEAEIAKCDLVCANCHKARTYDRILKPNGQIFIFKSLTFFF